MKRVIEHLRSTVAVLGAAAMVTAGTALFDVHQMKADAQEKEITVTEEGDDVSDRSLKKDQEQLSEQETMTSDQKAEAETETPTAEGIFVIEQLDDEVNANRYIGQTVYNAADENVGDINDLVFSKEGGLSAAVIGVGGFLGLGEKEVAVRFDAINIVEDVETGSFELVINASREELENAPRYVTKAQKLAEERAAEMERQQAEGDVLNPIAPNPDQ